MLKPDRPWYGVKQAAAPSTTGSAEPPKIPPGPKQLAAMRKFVAQVGGIENARSALELLALLSSADQPKGTP
jgi:hypothetical protein